MATVLRTWRVDGDSLAEMPEIPAAEQGLIEEQLETWLASQPDAIQDNLMIIGRQIETASGPLDLLGLTSDGRLVVVELKRDRAPRESVAQALDYASWVAGLQASDVVSLASRYVKNSVEDAFRERFGQEMPELQVENLSIRVVATKLDAATERMIQYLSKQFAMDIDGLVFRYVRLPGGDDILVRTSIVPEETRITTQQTGKIRAESLEDQAHSRQVSPIVARLRSLREFLQEEPARTYGGSFRYWSNGRMLCGVNVTSNWAAPIGAVDIWVSQGILAQVTGLDEAVILSELEGRFEVIKRYQGAHQTIFRMRSQDMASNFVELVRTWLGSPGDREGQSKDTSDYLQEIAPSSESQVVDPMTPMETTA